MRSTNRGGWSGGGGGPAMGDWPVRLRWSERSTGWPTAHEGFSPPAALVSTTVRQPAATAVRTPWTTVETG